MPRLPVAARTGTRRDRHSRLHAQGEVQRARKPAFVAWPPRSRLYLHSRVAFATLYTLQRTIICIPGANTPSTLRKGRYSTLSLRNTSPLFLSFHRVSPREMENERGREREREQARRNNGYGKTTALGWPIETWLMRPSRRNGSSLRHLFCPSLSSLFCHSENWSNDVLYRRERTRGSTRHHANSRAATFSLVAGTKAL